MDLKPGYYEDGNTPQTDLQSQYNPYHNSNCLCFLAVDKLNPKFIRNYKNPRIAKNLKQEKENWRIHTF